MCRASLTRPPVPTQRANGSSLEARYGEAFKRREELGYQESWASERGDAAAVARLTEEIAKLDGSIDGLEVSLEAKHRKSR